MLKNYKKYNRILIFVNKFDKNDDLLGFFTGWAKELAARLPVVIVVTQHLGEFDQAGNLKVYSIDKKQNPNQVLRILKFWRLLWRLRREYDSVFVIMAPSWVIAASLLTKILEKKLYLWYAVWRGSWRLRLAEKLADKIFCSVPEAFPFRTQKLVPVGQGIDVEKFKIKNSKLKIKESRVFKIVSVGRISPVKKLEVLIEAIAELNKSNSFTHDMEIEIIGGAANKGDSVYLEELREFARKLGVAEKIKWPGRISHSQTPKYYQEADVTINLTPTGSFDKTILEAMACGSLVLVSNQTLVRFFTPEQKELLIFNQDDPVDLAQKILDILNLDSDKTNRIRSELRDIIVKHHSQKLWAEKLVVGIRY